VIGSGPTVPDRSTFAEARAVVKKYGLEARLPKSVHKRLYEDALETPKPGEPIFRKVRNLIVGSNRMAVDAAARRARDLGFHTLILSTVLQGEAREAGRLYAAIAREIAIFGRPARRPACIITGGETTVTVRGKGRGGRN